MSGSGSSQITTRVVLLHDWAGEDIPSMRGPLLEEPESQGVEGDALGAMDKFFDDRERRKNSFVCEGLLVWIRCFLVEPRDDFGYIHFLRIGRLL